MLALDLGDVREGAGACIASSRPRNESSVRPSASAATSDRQIVGRFVTGTNCFGPIPRRGPDRDRFVTGARCRGEMDRIPGIDVQLKDGER